jgi:hypothetical protein
LDTFHTSESRLCPSECSCSTSRVPACYYYSEEYRPQGR